MTTDPDPADRKVTAMAEWADVPTRSPHDALERMGTTLMLAEAKCAMVREMVARRANRDERHATCISIPP